MACYKLVIVRGRFSVFLRFILFIVILPYKVMSVNSTFVLVLFVIDVPTLNKVLSYLAVS